jgi:hypothetical protein
LTKPIFDVIHKQTRREEMTYTINKSRNEKIQDIIKAKTKADYDIILYWHFQSIKEEIFKDIDNIQ